MTVLTMLPFVRPAEARKATTQAAITEPQTFLPLYEWRAKDGAQLMKLARENAWMGQFLQSNLWRGLSVRVGPALSMVADPKTDFWQGRLFDFVVEKALAGHPAVTAYFLKPHLASPLGLRIENLGETEKKVLAPVLRQFRVRENIEVGIETGLKSTVDMLSIQGQNFALSLRGDCLSIGRDPAVVAAMSLLCPKTPVTDAAAARLTIDLERLAPPLSRFATKFSGLGHLATIDFAWDGGGKRYVAERLSLPIEDRGVLHSEAWPAELAQIVPADTSALVAAFVARPASYSSGDVQAHLRASADTLKKAKSALAVLVVVPMPEKLVTVLLLRDLDGKQIRMNQAQELFSGVGDATKVKSICGFIAASFDAAALEHLQSACDKKIPTLADQAELIRKTLQPARASAVAWINLPDLSQAAFAIGAKNEKMDAPEMLETKKLLSQLPQAAFAGDHQGGRLELTGTQP